jgi:hypothetical protein
MLKGCYSMYRYPKISWSGWCTSLLIFSVLALSVLVRQDTPAFAAACNPGTPLDASVSSAACDMSITAQVNPGVLTLTNDAAAVVNGTPFTLVGIPLVATFTFTSLVKDHRGVGLGWVLSAASAGISNAGTTLPLSLTAKDAGSTCVDGPCLAAVFIPVTLTATPSRFLTTSNITHTTIIDGDYSNKIDGAFTIPTGSPSGTYSGIITITLLNSF